MATPPHNIGTEEESDFIDLSFFLSFAHTVCRNQLPYRSHLLEKSSYKQQFFPARWRHLTIKMWHQFESSVGSPSTPASPNGVLSLTVKPKQN